VAVGAAVATASDPLAVAAIATPAPVSSAAAATAIRSSGRPGSLRLPSMDGRPPSGRLWPADPAGIFARQSWFWLKNR
jgi:hypothetical protein